MFMKYHLELIYGWCPIAIRRLVSCILASAYIVGFKYYLNPTICLESINNRVLLYNFSTSRFSRLTINTLVNIDSTCFLCCWSLVLQVAKRVVSSVKPVQYSYKELIYNLCLYVKISKFNFFIWMSPLNMYVTVAKKSFLIRASTIYKLIFEFIVS